MDRQSMQPLPQRSLQDVLRDLTASESKCKALSHKNQKHFDCFERKANQMGDGWQSRVDHHYFV